MSRQLFMFEGLRFRDFLECFCRVFDGASVLFASFFALASPTKPRCSRTLSP